MSIVEKAVERLKSPPLESPVSPQLEATPQHAAPTIERLQERERAVEQPAEAPSCRVDRAALEDMGLIPADDEAIRRLADELRRVKRPLLNNAAGRGAGAIAHGERIVVTSAGAGEGKTFAALNLALSLARETDFEVLLVDGDIPKSDITRVFGLDQKPGLMDVLADERRAPAGVIVRTDVPNLLLVPAGERHPLAAELLRSRRMEYVLDAWGGGDRRRLMLFDSPPLLATSESQVLVSQMGQVVMVVAAGHTRRQAVNTALRTLGGHQFVGLVLNMSRLPASEDYYDRHYGNYFRALKGGI